MVFKFRRFGDAGDDCIFFCCEIKEKESLSVLLFNDKPRVALFAESLVDVIGVRMVLGGCMTFIYLQFFD